MSDIVKNIFENQKDDFLELCGSVEELAENYGLEPDFQSAYVMILNPDHDKYDYKLTKMEVDHDMISAGYCDTQCGFDQNNGEVGRIGMFQESISSDEIREFLGDVLYDIYQLK